MNIYEPTREQRRGWDRWLRGRPKVVADLAVRFPPWTLFRMASSGHRCQVLSYGEDGTVRVSVDGRFNRVVFSREVFGVVPDDLTECDLPDAGEDLGDAAAEAGYTEDDIRTILIPRMVADRAAEAEQTDPAPRIR